MGVERHYFHLSAGIEMFRIGTYLCFILKPHILYSLIFRHKVEREIPNIFAAFVVLPETWLSTRRMCSASSWASVMDSE